MATNKKITMNDRINKLNHFITCLKCEVSGKCCDENCPTQYDAGNMGEIIENLEFISTTLEQEFVVDKYVQLIEHLRRYISKLEIRLNMESEDVNGYE